ncbi:MAG: zf-HC2 domain-containing protein [Spirochaetales bacterium]|nr:zf-HC2 domain-containing protein [Spirochaetales bacterium]
MNRISCPKNDVLSAYFDGEIGSPWDAAIAAHLENCASCRGKISAWEAVSGRLRREEAPELEEAARRVRQRIDLSIEERDECVESASVEVPVRRSEHGREVERLAFFRRQVLLPVPVLAGGVAAMFVLVASLFFFVGKNGSELSQTRAELENLKTIHVQYRVQNRAQLFGVMNTPGFEQDVVFELPDNNAFNVRQPEVIYVTERR